MTTRTRYAKQLLGGSIGRVREHVADAREGDVERIVIEREVRRSTLTPEYLLDTCYRGVLSGLIKQCRGDVQTCDAGTSPGGGDGNISGPTADIQHGVVRTDVRRLNETSCHGQEMRCDVRIGPERPHPFRLLLGRRCFLSHGNKSCPRPA